MDRPWPRHCSGEGSSFGRWGAGISPLTSGSPSGPPRRTSDSSKRSKLCSSRSPISVHIKALPEMVWVSGLLSLRPPNRRGAACCARLRVRVLVGQGKPCPYDGVIRYMWLGMTPHAANRTDVSGVEEPYPVTHTELGRAKI